jgi:hypothetical protein
MANGLDLSKVKEEISNRKKQRDGITEGSDGTQINPRYAFLHQLNNSLYTGKKNEATEHIKIIENKTAMKVGETPKMSVSNNIPQPPVNVQKQHNPQMQEPPKEEYKERDYLLYEEVERKQREMYNGGYKPPINQPQQNPHSPNAVLNEEYLSEVVNKRINEGFVTIVEQAMRDNIVEVYTKARMTEVLKENRDFLKGIVMEVLKEVIKKKSQ